MRWRTPKKIATRGSRKVSEPALEPDLPIVDPHHHLWDHPGSRYMLDEILRDTNSGHRVLATVFVECMSMYRADGPESMRPVGETEFVNGIAAQSASGQYGETRVAAGIVGFADLTLAERRRAGARSAYRRGAGTLSWNPACGRLRRESRGAQFAHQPAGGSV